MEDKKEIEDRVYNDGREAKGYQIVIEKLQETINDLRQEIQGLRIIQRTDRTNYEIKMAAREAEHLECIKLQERLKAQNENLSIEINRLREQVGELIKDQVSLKGLVERLSNHDTRNTQHIDVLKQEQARLEGKLDK